MKVILGADHRGFELKQQLKKYLEENQYEVIEVGSKELIETDDYPDVALKAATEVLKNEGSKGIVICGSGVGVCITANKVKGIRSGLGMKAEQVQSAREHDDINVLALASDYTDEKTAQELVKTFLTTSFDGKESHARRINKISAIEQV